MVPKRYPETLKIAAISEVNRMLVRSGKNKNYTKITIQNRILGVQSQVKSLLNQGKKFASCVQSCMEKRTGNCAKKLK